MLFDKNKQIHVHSRATMLPFRQVSPRRFYMPSDSYPSNESQFCLVVGKSCERMIGNGGDRSMNTAQIEALKDYK